MLKAILQSLNAPQKEAVMYDKGSMLVLAGAGSGKTKVLTTRIAWLLSSGKAIPSTILAVTFTNKAAKEMLFRVSTIIPHNLQGMWIGTFHGLCNRMLRMHFKEAALPRSFQILDMQDQLSSIKRLLREKNIDSDLVVPKELQRFINNAKEEGLRAREIDDTFQFNRKFIELYEEYDLRCQREGVVDFGELLLRSVELLQRSSDLREHYQIRFKSILIDEFQDTNPLQYKWLKLLTGSSGNAFAVGDDDQSIYAFRGADTENMERFKNEFNVKDLIRLEQNYRSCGHILDAANSLIENNKGRLGKNLWTDAGKGEKIKLIEVLEDGLEAKWVVEEVSSLIKENKSPNELAILYRSNAQSRILEHELNKRGISYRVYGGFRFYDRAEIKHALAYLRLLENSSDDNSFLRVVNFPPRKIGTKSLEALSAIAKNEGGLSLFDSVSMTKGKLFNTLERFTKLIKNLRSKTCDLPLPTVVDIVTKESGLNDHYAKEKDGFDRLENLRELVTAANGFLSEEKIDSRIPSNSGAAADQTSEPEILEDLTIEDISLNLSPLTRFLEHASLESGENQAENGKEAIQLMTVHSAKGLEFEIVFITGLEEGLFPHENSLNERDGIEEERRLMYVALTRAKKQLYLSYSQTRKLYGQYRYHKKSRFINEIPEDNLNNVYSELSERPIFSRKESFEKAFIDEHSVLEYQQENEFNIKVGLSVHHKKFGRGVVLNVEGIGSEARAQVEFEKVGSKWLALSVAKLEVV
ncbi:MAG: DNA helicase II [Betaproteobacteria bacterium TMED82]|nr:MAG: DNA helicase II [Betaproteobacteria bacterium TMED82]|tara:strand:- start:58456 stop:60714 length:2259 start_codon:yes stop_codon:yes gene_type:complete